MTRLAACDKSSPFSIFSIRSTSIRIAAFLSISITLGRNPAWYLQLLTLFALESESTSIPKNPRTDRPVGYAFVDLSTPSEAERAIAELSGKEILDRKVSVQLARKPEQNAEKAESAAAGGAEAQNGEDGNQRRPSGRGRGRGRGRAGRDRRLGRGVGPPDSVRSTAGMLIFSG